MTTDEPTKSSTLTLRWKGTDYVLDPNRISAADTRLVRRATGESLRYWMNLGTEGTDIDAIAIMLWVASRHAGVRGAGSEDLIGLAEIENQISLGTIDAEIEFDPSDAVDVADAVVQEDDDVDPFDGSSGTS